jgi:hypothetical protein
MVTRVTDAAELPVAPSNGSADEKETKLFIVDCDIHQDYKSNEDLYPYLPKVYREIMEDFGVSMGGLTYPSIAKGATRHDLWTDDRTHPGTNLELVRTGHLDRYGIDYGILTGGPYGTSAMQDADFAAGFAGHSTTGSPIPGWPPTSASWRRSTSRRRTRRRRSRRSTASVQTRATSR